MSVHRERWRLVDRVGVACGLLILLAGWRTASAAPLDRDPDVLAAAVAAFETHEAHCAELASGRGASASDALLKVGATWHALTTLEAEKPAPTVHYWLGVLSACLGQDERAQDQLRSFLSQAGRDPDLSSMVRDARRRLGRLDAGRAPGPGAAPPRPRSETPAVAPAPPGKVIDRFLRLQGHVGPSNWYLHFLGFGGTTTVFPLPWLGIDATFEFMALRLGAFDEGGDLISRVSVLPSWSAGLSLRAPTGPFRPWVGLRYSMLEYSALPDVQGPLWSLGGELVGGFDVGPGHVGGVGVEGRVGFERSKDINNAVSLGWALVAPTFSVAFVGFFEVPRPGR